MGPESFAIMSFAIMSNTDLNVDIVDFEGLYNESFDIIRIKLSNSTISIEFDTISVYQTGFCEHEGDRSMPILCRIRSISSNSTGFHEHEGDRSMPISC